MRAVAAIPAVGLLAGSAVGLLAPDLPPVVGYAALTASVAWSLHAWRGARVLHLAVAVGLTFFTGGVLLAAHAWHDAWRPTLRVVFEQLASAERAEAERQGWAPPEDDSALAVLSGVLRADASSRPGGISLSLDVRSVRGTVFAKADEDIPVRGGVLLTVTGELAVEHSGAWRAGRTIRVPARLRRPSRYLNPGVPDEERALARRGTTLVGSVKSGALVEVVAKGGRPSETAAEIRAFVRRAVSAAVGRWSTRSAAIVVAILIGDRAGLDDDVERRLQQAGTYHVIAISGGNIAILAALALIGFRVAGSLGRVAMVTAIAGLLAYCYVVGGGASVNRATLMAVVYFGARALDLRGPPMNALALVAGLLVVSEPLAIVDPGFLLTFGATTAIVLVVPLVPVGALPAAMAPFAAMFAASVAAEAVLLPVSAFLFSRVTFAGLALNFAAIPLMAMAQIAGLVLLPAAAVWQSLAAGIGWIAHAGAEGLVRSAGLVELAPVLTWRLTPPSWFAIVAYYVSLITAWSLWRLVAQVLGSRESRLLQLVRRSAAAAAVASLVWILVEPWAVVRSRGDGRLHVTFIDVGQGDAALVRFPKGSTLLVDAGGLPGSSSFDIGDRVVAPVLRRAGIRRLQSVALTHGDADHIGGAASILGEFSPADVWEGIPVPPLETLGTLREAADNAGATWTNVQTNDLITIDGVQVVVRHPPIADWERQDVRNDDSIVLELVWRDLSIVLTGDIGKEVEHAIAPTFPPSPLRIVKVPHHGSLTSSSLEFVRALAPRVAVVSVGRGNAFGHPATEVLDRYRRSGADVFRTDQDGAVTIDTDGYFADVRTFTGRRTFLRAERKPRRHEEREDK